MQAAADNLEVSLEVVYGNNNPNIVLEEGTRVINRKIKPDYLLMVNDIASTPILMKLVHQHGQKTFLFNAAIEEGVYDPFKSKNENSSSWLVSLIPDDEQAGYQLAKVLVTQAREKGLHGKNEKINIIGVNGKHHSLVPERRERGLTRFVNENDDIRLQHVVSAYWGKERAEEIVKNCK